MNMFTCNQYSTVEHVSALNQPKASNLLKLVDLAGQKSFFTRYRLIELDTKLYTTVAELSSYTHVATCTPQASTLFTGAYTVPLCLQILAAHSLL